MSYFSLYSQHPQCEGINQSRQVFTTIVAPVSLLAAVRSNNFSMVITAPNRRVSMGRGLLRGSVKSNEARQPFGLEFGEGLSEEAEKFREALDRDNQCTVEQDPAPASTISNDLLISSSGPDFTFDAVSEPCSKFGFKRLPYTVPHSSDRLNFVLSAASNFSFHLRRRPESSVISRDVVLEFTELEEIAADKDLAVQKLRPSSENLINGDNEIHLGICSMIEKYGIRITNNSTSDLYPALFYFDNSDFSIRESSSLSPTHALM